MCSSVLLRCPILPILPFLSILKVAPLVLIYGGSDDTLSQYFNIS